MSFMRRIEDDIRSLSARLSAARKDRDIRRIVMNLRAALQTKIERFRSHIARYPFAVELRVKRIPSLDTPKRGERRTEAHLFYQIPVDRLRSFRVRQAGAVETL